MEINLRIAKMHGLCLDFLGVVSLLLYLINPFVFQYLGAKEQMEIDLRLTTTLILGHCHSWIWPLPQWKFSAPGTIVENSICISVALGNPKGNKVWGSDLPSTSSDVEVRWPCSAPSKDFVCSQSHLRATPKGVKLSWVSDPTRFSTLKKMNLYPKLQWHQLSTHDLSWSHPSFLTFEKSQWPKTQSAWA